MACDVLPSGRCKSFFLYVQTLTRKQDFKLFSWRSKLQKSVSLSSSEVEYIALSEAVKEVMFVVQLLESMKMLLSIQSW